MASSANLPRIGKVITVHRNGADQEAVILDREPATGDVFILWLSDQACDQVPAGELEGWTEGTKPDARWVEIYAKGAQTPFFASYVPNFHSALAVLRAFKERKPDHRVVVYTADDYEDSLVAEIWDPETARGYS